MSTLTTAINPAGLPTNPAFAQGIVTAQGRTLYVGGQNGTDAQGGLADGLEAQTAQAMRNVLAVLDQAGTGPQHVARLTIHLVAGSDPRAAFAASGPIWETTPPRSPCSSSLVSLDPTPSSKSTPSLLSPANSDGRTTRTVTARTRPLCGKGSGSSRHSGLKQLPRSPSSNRNDDSGDPGTDRAGRRIRAVG